MSVEPPADEAIEGAPRLVVKHLIIDVRGVRPGTFATAAERPWKSAVTQAAEQTGEVLIPGARLSLEVDFTLPPASATTHGWDLDNLLKPTIDALISVLGNRPGSWRHQQADDERIDRIVASKRSAETLDVLGATITLTVIDPGSYEKGTPPTAASVHVALPRPILREHTHDGRVIGDPLPLALGVGVEVAVASVIEQALEAFLLPREQVLFIAHIKDVTWEMYYVLTSHHYCRVALGAEHTEARVVAWAFEHAGGGAVDIHFRSGEEVNVGRLAHVRDRHLLNSAMWNLSLPEGSDGRTAFAQSEAVATGVIALR